MLLLATLLLSVTPGTDPVSKQCHDRAMSQAQTNKCVSEEFKRADSALNLAYQAAMARIRADVSFMRNDDGRQRGDILLRDIQKAWIIQREKLCQLQSYVFRGGSLEGLIYNGCRAEFTRERTIWLENINPPADRVD